MELTKLLRHIARSLLVLVGSLVCAMGALAAEGAHRHHLAGVLGGTWKDSDKTAGTYGVEYAYQLNERFALGAWYELASGDFDLESLGALGKIYVAKSLPVLLGAGAERKLFDDKTHYLLRTGLQYEFHAGRVSVAPAAWIDWVDNGEQLYFIGATVGIGF